MSRRPAFAVIIALLLSLTTGPAAAAPPQFTPGASGLGDPYFPADGNGGYDVEHYLLEVRYDPATDTLNGVATITARATQNLSRFNLDFDDPLQATSVVVNRMPAASVHTGDELVITPASGIRNNTRFVVVIAYEGVPETIEDFLGTSGFIHTEDGALVIGQPHVAATWFPANDHPSDRAAFTFRVTVPAGLEVVANGRLAGQSTAGDWTTWEWEAADPMATYLAGMAIGELAV
ncbi:MAG TPA: M1 family peptidase, partial [Candidatus Limnocylindria bacterium]|nr:M1 family peptidase [Candidatus Limnocylindria bacterium]